MPVDGRQQFHDAGEEEHEGAEESKRADFVDGGRLFGGSEGAKRKSPPFFDAGDGRHRPFSPLLKPMSNDYEGNLTKNRRAILLVL